MNKDNGHSGDIPDTALEQVSGSTASLPSMDIRRNSTVTEPERLRQGIGQNVTGNIRDVLGQEGFAPEELKHTISPTPEEILWYEIDRQDDPALSELKDRLERKRLELLKL